MKRLSFIIFFILIFIGAQVALANNSKNRNINIRLDKETIAKGYTVSSSDDYLKLSLVPGILSEDTRVLIEEIPDQEMMLPWSLEKESAIFQFEFLNKRAYDNHKPFYIQFSYDNSNNNLKQVFFYDKTCNLWRPLPTWDFPGEKFVRSLIHLPYARIAVFSYPEILSSGQASWYKYKGGNFTASTDFPKGSVLRVKNLENNKIVDVVVNDFGPDRSRFPNRVLDLDYEAFKLIANKGDGLINVSIEPLNVLSDNLGRKLGLNPVGASLEPEVKSISAVLIRESDKEIILEKNADQILPMASLSKIFSVFTFLNIDNNQSRLEEIVNYSDKDEEYNLNYFNKWEIARVNLNDNDTLSIKDLVYSAMVRSANNVVETLVRVSGLSRDQFISKINSWARENGASTIRINEPTGLDKSNVGSAKDIALLASKIFDNQIIKDASISKSYSFVTRNDNSLKLRYNSSDLVLNNNYRNFKIIGSKTGYLDEAGYCLITRAEIKGEKFIVVILNSPSRARSFSETIDLLNYASYKFSN
ncbi:MAG: serine hydrolase [Patescibacteria group bacterium]|nr:serine hydrolase [Patescibacteria group bacterium]